MRVTLSLSNLQRLLPCHFNYTIRENSNGSSHTLWSMMFSSVGCDAPDVFACTVIIRLVDQVASKAQGPRMRKEKERVCEWGRES